MKRTLTLLFFVTLLAASKSKLPVSTDKKPIPAKKEAVAQPESLEKELKTYQDKLKNRIDLTVAFTQTTYKDLRKNTVKSQGTASFHRPNQFRWSTQKPVAQAEEWIFTGTELFSHKNAIFTRYRVTGTIGKEIQQVVDMVINFDQLMKKYTLKQVTKEKDRVTILLLPLVASDLQSATLQLDTQKNFISQVRLDFVGKNHTIFDFSAPDTRSLPAATFTIPKEAVVKEAL